MTRTSCCTRLACTFKPAERRLLASDIWSISAIVRWEICKLQQLGRIDARSSVRHPSRIAENRVVRLIVVWSRMPVKADTACRAS